MKYPVLSNDLWPTQKKLGLPCFLRFFFQENQGKPFPAAHVQKAIEEIEELCHVLQGEGVIVKRPDIIDWGEEYKTPDFTSTGLLLVSWHLWVLAVCME